MKAAVEIYVKSFSFPPDVESYRIHRMHSHCAPGLAQAGLELPGFKGRILEADSAAILSLVGAVRKQRGEQGLTIQAVDVGRLRGRLKALAAGVWRTPAVVVGGKRHIGLSAASEALHGLGADSGSHERRE